MVKQERYVCALAVSVVTAGLLSGCVPPRHEAFAPVETTVRERTGLHIARRRPGASEAVRTRLESILAKPLTADAAVELALLNNENLQAELEAVNIGLGDVAEASVLRNPQVSAEVRWPTSGSGRAVEFHAAQDLVSLLTLSGRRKAAFASLDAERADAAGAVIDLVADVRRAFYDLQGANQILDFRQTVRESLSAQLDLTTRLHAAGNVTDLAVSQQRALLAQAHLDLTRAQLAVVAARERVNSLLGLGEPTSTAWTLAGELRDLPERAEDLADLEQAAVTHNLGLARERGRGRAAAERLGVARLQAWLPTLGPGVSAQKEVGGAWTVGPEVVLSIPLFDRKQGSRIREHANLRRARDRMRALAVTIGAAARTARAEIHNAYARARFASRELLPARQRALDETLLQYNAMNATPFELLQAERDRIAAGVEAIESLRDYWRAHARVEQIRAGSTNFQMMNGGMQ